MVYNSQTFDYGGCRYELPKKNYDWDIFILMSFYYMEQYQESPQAYLMNCNWQRIDKISEKELSYNTSNFVENNRKLMGNTDKYADIYRVNFDGNWG